MSKILKNQIGVQFIKLGGNLITSLVSVWWFTRYKQGCILKCSVTRVIFDHLRLHMCLLFLPKPQGGIMWTFSSFIQQCFCIKQRGKAKICSQWEHYHPITCGNTARWATPVCKKGSLKHWQYHLSRESIDRGSGEENVTLWETPGSSRNIKRLSFVSQNCIIYGWTLNQKLVSQEIQVQTEIWGHKEVK